jgi:aspartokinase/homoserine dehydrogenase 1
MKKLSLSLVFFIFSFFSIASSSEQVIHVFLVGPGLVGGELLNQINDRFSTDKTIEIRVVGLANSRFMHFDSIGIDLNNWKSELTRSNRPMSIDEFINEMVNLKLTHSVFVDCTSSQLIADSYQKILQSNISIVTPNKKANSGSLLDYSALRNLVAHREAKFLYDANVGAGLPILKTIKTIKRNGDSIVKLEAILSGTLSYLFNTFDGSIPFSKILHEAQEKGYTEPDPRDDLNGLDMARKFLILAREAGLMLEMNDITIESFLPNECFEAVSVSEFYHKLEEFDEQFSVLAKQARQNGQVLRFIGTLENGRVALSLKAVDKDHPFYNLSDTDNIASISSLIYSKNPIVIKGPGAGASITASNVLSNIIEVGIEK